MPNKRACLSALLVLFCPAATGAAASNWGPEERLTTNATVAETGLNHGALAADSQGRITAAWAEQDGPDQNFQIYTRTTQTDGTWGPAQLAVAYSPAYAGAGLGAKFPALAVLPGDTLSMVWHDYRVDGIQNAELFTKVRTPGLAWGDSTTEVRLTTSLHPETNGDNSYMPNVALGPDGDLHVAWYDYRFDPDRAEILFKSRVNGIWNTTAGDAPDTNRSQSPGESHFPALAAGPGGTLHLAWRDNTGGTFQIVYRSRSPQGAWSPADTLSPPGIAASGAALAAAADGRAVAVWSDARYGAQTVFLRERENDAWGPTRQVSPSASGAEEAAVQIDALLRVHVVWQDGRISAFNRELFYQSRLFGEAWDATGGSDTQLSNAAGASTRPTLLVGPANRLTVLWQDARHGPTEIYARRQAAATGVPDTPRTGILTAGANPFHGAVTWNLPAGYPRSARAVIYNAQGRRVRVLPHFGLTPRWDGTTQTGTPAAPGLYLVEVRAPDHAPVRGKVVKLP